MPQNDAMSYCRFSTDDYQCDVYVYEDVSGGWTTHVAASHPVYDVPLPEPVPYEQNFEAWFRRHNVVAQLAREARRVPLPPPHAGQSYNDPTPGACADRLAMLKAEGFHVPQDAIDALRAEQAERGAE